MLASKVQWVNIYVCITCAPRSYWWWHDRVVNSVGLINEVNQRRAWLLLGWVTVFGR